MGFLRRIDIEVPRQLDLHLIVDNYCTHKHAKVKAWLSQRQGADRHNQEVRGGLQQDKSPVQVDCNGGFNPGENPETMLVNLQVGALGHGAEGGA